MSVQAPFTLPLRGLGQGTYMYNLRVDDAFFASFPDAPVDRADIDLVLTVDRRTREMTLTFAFDGTIATACDRCTADIDLPVRDERHLVAKFVASTDGLEDDADLIYLETDTSLFNVAPYAYELILLSIPMIRTYDCRAGEPPYPCDEDLLARIDDSIEFAADGDDAKQEPQADKPSPWDVLKGLN